MNYATADSPNFDNTTITDYLTTSDVIKTIPALLNFDASQWFIFNKQQFGYYRVNYDFANWHMLLVTLNSEHYTDIHVLNRAQIMSDVLAFGAAGLVDYELVIGMLGYLENEIDYIPWASAGDFLNMLNGLFGGHNVVFNVSAV